ncbi:MAG: bifunctional UDP-N-acetylglucosamine diphosphorylase/glucosamine-1-phosphate N-acetyltransferase GlmU [Defluviitaleaceae bacterium]|nr:bifunctional UDP-N-acetylglucosamine diphosphorylase/glucosamine-1-phosphate N-acetyltransferase GlmU [Defluviitaleaceae bacterium]
MHNFAGVVLAAGIGSRMKSKLPKVLHKIFDKTMLEYCARALEKAGATHIIIVTGHKEDLVKQEISKWKLCCDVSTAYQENQRGTGHAVKMAMPLLKQGNVVVMCGDGPLITEHTLIELVNDHVANGRQCTLVSTIVDNPFGYGRIIRKSNGELTKIVEERDSTKKEKLVKEVNPSLYCFNVTHLGQALEKITNDNAAREYYITDTIEILLKNGGKVDAKLSFTPQEFLSVNTRIELAHVTKIMQQRITESHMLNGVTIVDTATTYIGSNVQIAQDTIIYPNTTIEGNSKIGSNCNIGPNSVVKNAEIGDCTNVINSTVTDSIIGENTDIGPYAHIRPESTVGDNARIGNFVEIKKSTIGNDTKAAHHSYVGDAIVGNNVNLSCGIITANYDGKNKHITTIEDGAFVGSNVNLVAPVTICKNAYVAAGTTVTHKVPENALAIGRARQEIKEEWKTKNNLEKS